MRLSRETMRRRSTGKSLLLLISFGAICLNCFLVADAQISSFQHVIVIVQENRTPDNLFQGLCAPPYAKTLCSTTPTGSQYNIQTNNWLDKHSTGGTINPTAVPLANQYDLSHAHSAFVQMCDAGPATGGCKMDGAGDISCSGICPPKPQFKFVSNSSGILKPYLNLATQYGWANYMFQTNQGPSFPAHQLLFGGTSAPSAADDAADIFVSEDDGMSAGCLAAPGTVARLIVDGVESAKNRVYPCFERNTVGDLGLSWRYYAPSVKNIWTAPVAIQHICGPSGGVCAGAEWKNITTGPANVLKDITNGKLAQVSWVIPTGQNSDHPRTNTGGGPSWVASIVNAIGNSSYWNNTAIIVTWDDWGGGYDHEPPTLNSNGYEAGFRVPLLFISAYTPVGTVSNVRSDFGSILRFVEGNFGIGQGALGFADSRATSDLSEFYDFSRRQRPFSQIPAKFGADHFLLDTTPATDPDDD